jgi:hypothetical protein
MKIIIVVAAFAFALSSTESTSVQNLKNARRTVADFRTLAVVLESYATDHNEYPGVATVAELGPLVVPKYVTALPLKDAWGTDYRYLVSPDRRHYRFVSAGADRAFDKQYEEITNTPPENHASDNFADDIVYQDNGFRRLPVELKKAFDLHEERRADF